MRTQRHAAAWTLVLACGMLLLVGWGPAPARSLAVALRGPGEIALVDLSNRQIQRSPIEGRPRRLAASPDGRFLYATVREPAGGDRVQVLRLPQLEEVASIPVGDDPRDLAVHPDGRRLYVALAGADRVAVLDLATHAVTTLRADPSLRAPHGLAISPDGTQVFVSNSEGDGISVFDAAEGSLAGFVPGVPGRGEPVELAISPDGRVLWATDGAGGRLVPCDVDDLSLLSACPVGAGGSSQPRGLGMAPNGQFMLVALGGSSTVAVVDTIMRNQMEQFPSGATATGGSKRVVVDFDSRRAFLTSEDDHLLTILAPEGHTNLPLRPGDRPAGMALLP